MVFYIKMEDFRDKARLVAGGHMIKVPATIMYASPVCRETVETIRIALMIIEFMKDARKTAVIVRALYCLSQQEQLSEAMV